MKKRLLYIWNHLEEGLIIFFFTLMLLTVFIQIVSRIALKSPPMFTEELARYIYIWLAFIGFSYITKTHSNLCLDVISGKIFNKGKKKIIFDLIINVVSIAVFLFIGYWSIEFVKFQWINPAPAMRFSQGIVYLICPIAMGLTVIRSIELIVQDVKKLAGKPVKEGV